MPRHPCQAIGGLSLLYLTFQFVVSSSSVSKNNDDPFSCVGKVIGGYYADIQDNCQTFHVCTLGEKGEIRDIVFRCLSGTVFDQETRVCEREGEVDCRKSVSFYHLNNKLYGPGIIPEIAMDPKETIPPSTEQQVLDPRDALMGATASPIDFKDKHQPDEPNLHSPPNLVPTNIPSSTSASETTFNKASTFFQSFNSRNSTRGKNFFKTFRNTPPFMVTRTASSTSVSASARVHIETPLSQFSLSQGIDHNQPSLPAPHLRPSLLKLAAQSRSQVSLRRLRRSINNAKILNTFFPFPIFLNTTKTKSFFSSSSSQLDSRPFLTINKKRLNVFEPPYRNALLKRGSLQQPTMTFTDIQTDDKFIDLNFPTCKNIEKTAFYPHPKNDCKTFQLCHPSSSKIIIDRRYICADDGFIFDTEQGKCSQKAYCGSSSEYVLDSYQKALVDLDALRLCSFMPQGSLLLDLISDCEQYFECPKGIDQNIEVKRCPEDFLFSQKHFLCIPGKKVECREEIYTILHSLSYLENIGKNVTYKNSDKFIADQILSRIKRSTFENQNGHLSINTGIINPLSSGNVVRPADFTTKIVKVNGTRLEISESSSDNGKLTITSLVPNVSHFNLLTGLDNDMNGTSEVSIDRDQIPSLSDSNNPSKEFNETMLENVASLLNLTDNIGDTTMMSLEKEQLNITEEIDDSGRATTTDSPLITTTSLLKALSRIKRSTFENQNGHLSINTGIINPPQSSGNVVGPADFEKKIVKVNGTQLEISESSSDNGKLTITSLVPKVSHFNLLTRLDNDMNGTSEVSIDRDQIPSLSDSNNPSKEFNETMLENVASLLNLTDNIGDTTMMSLGKEQLNITEEIDDSGRATTTDSPLITTTSLLKALSRIKRSTFENQNGHLSINTGIINPPQSSGNVVGPADFEKKIVKVNGTQLEISESSSDNGKLTITSLVPKVSHFNLLTRLDNDMNGTSEVSIDRDQIPSLSDSNNPSKEFNETMLENVASLQNLTDNIGNTTMMSLGKEQLNITEEIDDSGRATTTDSPLITTTSLLKTTISIEPFSQRITNPIATNFSCKDKELEQFYPDIEKDCRHFHFCIPFIGKGQVLDLIFLCSGDTRFDDITKKCQHDTVCGVTSTIPTPTTSKLLTLAENISEHTTHSNSTESTAQPKSSEPNTTTSISLTSTLKDIENSTIVTTTKSEDCETQTCETFTEEPETESDTQTNTVINDLTTEESFTTLDTSTEETQEYETTTDIFYEVDNETITEQTNTTIYQEFDSTLETTTNFFDKENA